MSPVHREVAGDGRTRLTASDSDSDGEASTLDLAEQLAMCHLIDAQAQIRNATAFLIWVLVWVAAVTSPVVVWAVWGALL